MACLGLGRSALGSRAPFKERFFMVKPDSEYPTTEQMREVYEAYKSGKPGSYCGCSAQATARGNEGGIDSGA